MLNVPGFFSIPIFYNLVSIITIDFSSVMFGIDDGTLSRSSFLDAFRNLYIFSYKKTMFAFTQMNLSLSRITARAGIYSSSLHLELMHHLSANASIFMAEAWALLITLKIICDRNIPKAIIFTNSESVLESLSSSRLNIDCYLIYAIKNQFYLVSRMNILLGSSLTRA